MLRVVLLLDGRQKLARFVAVERGKAGRERKLGRSFPIDEARESGDEKVVTRKGAVRSIQ